MVCFEKDKLRMLPARLRHCRNAPCAVTPQCSAALLGVIGMETCVRRDARFHGRLGQFAWRCAPFSRAPSNLPVVLLRLRKAWLKLAAGSVGHVGGGR
jgi:hypothetical protein